jgi:hypothetical protein
MRDPELTVEERIEAEDLAAAASLDWRRDK